MDPHAVGARLGIRSRRFAACWIMARARALLAGELGLEPGEELRRLEQAVLRQEVRRGRRPRGQGMGSAGGSGGSGGYGGPGVKGRPGRFPGPNACGPWDWECSE